MSRWVHAVRHGVAIDDVIPVAAEPSLEHAEMLAGRLALIETEVIRCDELARSKVMPNKSLERTREG